MEMKHLVIDARAALPQVDGLGRYLREVVPRVVAEGAVTFRTTILVNPALEAFWREATPAAKLIVSQVRPMWPGQNWLIPRLVDRLEADLFFYPAHDPPLFLKTPLLFTVHDLSPLQVRPYFERWDGLKTQYLRRVTGSGLRKARAVMAVSGATRQAIGELFGAELLPKVHVTPNGICPPSTEVDAGVARDRFLYVGTDRPHKNLPRLVEAYALARRDETALPPLEIVGGLRSPELLRAAVRRHGVEGCVTLRGHVSEAELEACYAGAMVLVFCSLAEGFGLPILEAMARGVPVITSNLSACAEVAGETALTVDPLDARAMAGAMVRLARSAGLRNELVEKGRSRAAEFKWERTARMTLEVIEGCLLTQGEAKGKTAEQGQTRTSAPHGKEDISRS
jgi:glycosyltransferase involved in cell wall biosynthesis